MQIKKIVVGVMSCMLVLGGTMTPAEADAAQKKAAAKAALGKTAAKPTGRKDVQPTAKAAVRGSKAVARADKADKAGKAGRQVAAAPKSGRQVARAGKGATLQMAERRVAPVVPMTSSQQFNVAEAGPAFDDRGPLVRSSAALVQDQASGEVLYEKNANSVVPIASITKLMTAMVVLDAKLPLDETLMVTDEDVDIVKGTRSRLSVGTAMSRETALLLALMSSENRAASALSRHYPGGYPAFIQAMNRKARSLGLAATQFADPTGLTSANSASPRDLVKLVEAASHYPLIRQFSTTVSHDVEVDGRILTFRNTNALVSSPEWDISLSKTGFISEAGRCLVMQAQIQGKPVAIVLMDSFGRFTRVADANRVRKWVEHITGGVRQAVRPDV